MTTRRPVSASYARRISSITAWLLAAQKSEISADSQFPCGVAEPFCEVSGGADVRRTSLFINAQVMPPKASSEANIATTVFDMITPSSDVFEDCCTQNSSSVFLSAVVTDQFVALVVTHRQSPRNYEEQLEKDAEWLKLPSPEEMEIKPELLSSIKIRLQIQL